MEDDHIARTGRRDKSIDQSVQQSTLSPFFLLTEASSSNPRLRSCQMGLEMLRLRLPPVIGERREEGARVAAAVQ